MNLKEVLDKLLEGLIHVIHYQDALILIKTGSGFRVIATKSQSGVEQAELEPTQLSALKGFLQGDNSFFDIEDIQKIVSFKAPNRTFYRGNGSAFLSIIMVKSQA